MDFISLIDGVLISDANIALQNNGEEEVIDLDILLSALIKKDEKLSTVLKIIKSVKFKKDDSIFIDIQDDGEEERADLNFSISALIKKDEKLAEILDYIKNVKIKNADFIFANDKEELVIDSGIEQVELKNIDNFDISVENISLRCFFDKTENKNLTISSIYLKELTLCIYQELIDHVLQSLKYDLEKNGVFNIKVILSSGKIILKGDFKKSIFTIPFRVEFSVDSKKSVVKIEIDKIHLLKSWNVPEFIIQNIVMEAIKNNLKYDFVKTYKNYCLVNLRRVIPEIMNYNTIDVSVSDDSIVLNISEKNNPIEENNLKNDSKETKETKEIKEEQEPKEEKIIENRDTDEFENEQ